MKTARPLVCLLLTMSVVAVADDRPVPAFPGAEGAGAFASGGRGGSVYRVTNLNSDGPGSLADAISVSNRIVVFTVSGIIDLAKSKGKGGKLQITEPNVTIAGQTAPGEGICLRGGSLQVHASNVIIRHLRSRRGFVRDGDMGDAIEAKPPKSGVQTTPGTEMSDHFAKRQKKKESRGKAVYTFGPMENVLFDHLSASWATDENLTCTHPNHTTIQWCIASEGLDYANPNQTPPNHSEGSLWGVGAANGRSSLHHSLYAHNRLRNPRLVNGDAPPAVLDFRNNVVYDASELFSHTGSGAVFANWIGNFYKAGPSTPSTLRGEMFRFENDPNSRLFAEGNVIADWAENTRDNWRAIVGGKKLTDEMVKSMRVEKPFDVPPVTTQTAEKAIETVLADAGATLPSRDAVDLRIINDVRRGTGRVISKETDLPAEQRWPDYRALPAPRDSDEDGIPDFWEEQFGLNQKDVADSAKIAASGYANIEHYFNNTSPNGSDVPIVFIAAAVSRALPQQDQLGEWKITRTGKLTEPLRVRFSISGNAVAGRDFRPLPEFVTIPAGSGSVALKLEPLRTAAEDATVVVNLQSGDGYHLGCPASSLVVVKN